MTIKITASESTRALANAQAELTRVEAEFARIKTTTEAMGETLPYDTVRTYEEQIARARYDYVNVKREADQEQEALPAPDTVRALIDQITTTAQVDFEAIEAAAPALRDAYNAYLTAVRRYNKNFGDNVRALETAGIPERGVSLDGKPIAYRDDPQIGLTFRHDGTTITYVNVADLPYDRKLQHIFVPTE